MDVSYFVFTSGEEGTSGIDWGVKFVSGIDRKGWYEWDTKYRATLKNFGLPPKLVECPLNEAGLLMLPWLDRNMMILVGFIFSYHDKQGGRPNISLVAALLPRGIYGSCAPADAVKKLWRQNRLEDIAKRPEDRETLASDRPEFLKFDSDEEKGSILYPKFWYSQKFTSLDWPKRNAVLCVNGEVKCLERTQRAPEPVSKRTSIIDGKYPGRIQRTPESVPTASGTHGPDKPSIWKKLLAVGVVLVLAIVVGVWLWTAPQAQKPENPSGASKDAPTDERPIGGLPVPSKEQKLAEHSIERVMERHNAGLDGLVEVYPVVWDEQNNLVTRKGYAIWKKGYGYVLFSSPESESEALLNSKPSYYVEEETFVEELARLLTDKTPNNNAEPLSDQGNVSYLRIEWITSPDSFKKEIQDEAVSLVKTVGDHEAHSSNRTAPDEKGVREGLAEDLEKRGRDSDNFSYAFVFEETEGLYKVIIHEYPLNEDWITKTRYYLKPGWVSVDQVKVTKFLDRNVKRKHDKGVEIHYETPFPPNEASGSFELFRKFAEQLLGAIKE